MFNTILNLSPQKQLLNFEEFTPAKIMVGCDINGWFETHKKSPVPERKRPPKYIHSRFNADKKFREINKFNQSPNKINLLSITKLKCQMDSLQSKFQIQDLSTNCKSTGQNSTQRKASSQVPVLNVNISSFQQLINNSQEQKKLVKPVQHFFNIREIQKSQAKSSNSGSATQRMQQRNRRINKILSCNKMKPNEKQQIESHIARKVFLINRSQQIINGNLSTNQKRALNMIVNKKNSIKIENIPEPIGSNRSLCYERYKNKPISDKFC